MELIIHGAAGHMGRTVEALAASGFAGAHTAALVDPSCPTGSGGNCYASLEAYHGPADVVVDFSNHAATGDLVAWCKQQKLPLVIATTGQTEAELEQIHEAAREIPIFHSANLSVGIAVLADLARRAAAAFPGADIEIVETHHNRKLDVPSGTALLLANAVREARPGAELNIGRHTDGKRSPSEIGIHSLRLGNETGIHEIHIATGSETLTLRHKAENRALFAEGALTAAAFLLGKAPGLYNMGDLLK